MPKTIWKAVLGFEDEQEITVPVGAELLCAREQVPDICIWYRCDAEAPKEQRTISIVGTGHPCPSSGRYLGTAALHGGQLMFHVFERVQ